MNTIEIDDILQRARSRNLLERRATSEVTYLGVFPFDFFPKKRLQAPSSSFQFVFNTDCSSKPGTHWLACYYDHPSNTLEFFDSYAQTPNFYNLLIPRNVITQLNEIPLQSEFSTVCGQYCIYYLVSRLYGKSTSILEFSKTLAHEFKSKNARDSFVSNRVRLLSKRCHSPSLSSILKRDSLRPYSCESALSRKRQNGTGPLAQPICINNSQSTLSSYFFCEQYDSQDSDFLCDEPQKNSVQGCTSLLSLNSICVANLSRGVFPLQPLHLSLIIHLYQEKKMSEISHLLSKTKETNSV